MSTPVAFEALVARWCEVAPWLFRPAGMQLFSAARVTREALDQQPRTHFPVVAFDVKAYPKSGVRGYIWRRSSES
jgi:hypothetical protein